MKTDEYDSAIVLFYAAWRALTAGRDEVLGRIGLGQVHHRVLFVLRRLPGLRVGELAQALGISRQALHRPLSELRQQGLVLAQAAEHSAREVALSISESGAALEREATDAQRQTLQQALTCCGARDIAGWRALMQAIAQTAPLPLPDRASEWLHVPDRPDGRPGD